MKKQIVFFLTILLSCFCSTAMAQTTTHHHKHAKHHIKPKKHVPKHVKTSHDPDVGYADIVIEAKTGRILHSTNPDQLRHPASLTKMMTLYMTFQALQTGKLTLNDKVPISANAAKQQPSKLGLRPGQEIRVEDAIMGLTVESANDIAVAMAEKLGGTESHFAELMTQQAHALGMMQTHFDNPSGLPDAGQLTTARDIAILAQKLIYHFPQYYHFFSFGSFTYNNITYHNHNHLMSHYPGMDGIKTGFIDVSGYNLAASAVRDNTRLIGVMFGGHTYEARDKQMAVLLDQGFSQEKALRRLE